jgi:uncharacterized integral membrane protein
VVISLSSITSFWSCSVSLSDLLPFEVALGVALGVRTDFAFFVVTAGVSSSAFHLFMLPFADLFEVFFPVAFAAISGSRQWNLERRWDV